MQTQTIDRMDSELVERTASGNVIDRSFTPAEGFSTMAKLLQHGYEELYYDAPYYWGVVSIPRKEIITYTEGDVYKIVAEDIPHLIAEIQSYLKFFQDDNYSKAAYGEIPGILKRLGA